MQERATTQRARQFGPLVATQAASVSASYFALAFGITRRSGGIRMNFTKPFFECSNSVPDTLSKLRELSGTEHEQSDREDDQQVQRLKEPFKHVLLLVTFENGLVRKFQTTSLSIIGRTESNLAWPYGDAGAKYQA